MVWTWYLLKFNTLLRRMQKTKKKSKTVPLAMETLLQSTYMDDRIDSMVNEDETEKLV